MWAGVCQGILDQRKGMKMSLSSTDLESLVKLLRRMGPTPIASSTEH